VLLPGRHPVHLTEHAVVIAGGGPTGLMLAGELALAGVDVVIVERRTSQDVDGSRALGLLSRTIEVLDQRGIAERFLEAGYVVPAHGYGGIRFDISDLPTRHNYVLALGQSRFEPILADWVGELGVPILRGREVVGFAQDDTGVDVEVSGDTSLRAAYLVGCDGGRSLIRKAAGIDFAGWDPSTSWMIAEVDMDEEPELGFRHDNVGTHAIGRAADGGLRILLTEREVEHTGEPSMDELREALVGVYGTDFGLRRASWISRFTDMTRQAASYRHGRVLLAGDAAHVHPPQGGQGMQTGVQDAVNLGWKLAQVVNETSPENLLDTYHAERHPVGARVLHNTMAQVALSRPPDDRHQALRDTMTELLSMDEPRRRIAAELIGLDIHYDLGDGHPLLGRRMPDLDLHTADGPTRVFTLLHDARPVLLNLVEPGGFDIAPWANRVRLVDAKHDGACELPILGEIAVPPAVLIRPDGHVAWAGDLTDPELPRAIASWFGAAAPA
jgi:3-(3-hydroxy-phenyl)propionate hydroxylase